MGGVEFAVVYSPRTNPDFFAYGRHRQEKAVYTLFANCVTFFWCRFRGLTPAPPFSSMNSAIQRESCGQFPC
jgi:hypothetical protein